MVHTSQHDRKRNNQPMRAAAALATAVVISMGLVAGNPLSAAARALPAWAANGSPAVVSMVPARLLDTRDDGADDRWQV